MELDVEIIHRHKDNIAIPINKDDIGLLQIRHDGVYINGELHLWENIKRVIIENKEN